MDREVITIMKQLLPKLIIISILLTACGSSPPKDILESTEEVIETTAPSPTMTEFIRPSATHTPANTNTTSPSTTPPMVQRPTTKPIPQDRPEDDAISGTYELDRGNGAGCRIKVLYEKNAPFDNLQLELSCNRGAPSYNLGYAVGDLLTANNIAVFSPNSECNIVFQFTGNQLVVTQIGMDFDCGFGHGVYASGVYQLVDSTLPILGCMAPTDPCNLSSSEDFTLTNR